jgi:hypothetical protein
MEQKKSAAKGAFFIFKIIELPAFSGCVSAHIFKVSVQ